jgi:hypothetical protein
MVRCGNFVHKIKTNFAFRFVFNLDVSRSYFACCLRFLFTQHLIPCFSGNKDRMITDLQLGIIANVLGVTIFVLVIIYHYVVANQVGII